MSYCNISDLEKAYDKKMLIDLSNDDGYSGDDINETNTLEIISETDSIIDSYLRGGGYNLPLLSIPKQINDIAQKIIFYKLLSRKNINNSKGRTDYQESIYFLEKISSGNIILDSCSDKSSKLNPKDFNLVNGKFTEDDLFGY